MEIHSSSLAFTPNRVEAKKKNETPLSPASEDSFNSPVAKNSQSPVKAEGAFKAADLDHLSNDIENLKKNPVNTQTNRALNAYIQENIQPLKSQRAELASRVDFYV